MNKHQKLMSLAEHIATIFSKDRNTKVGAVAVDDLGGSIGWGYNGFPRGINDEISERHDRPAKYLWSNHAEMNLINDCARMGKRLTGATVYCTMFPCANCMGAMINAGVKRLITEPPTDHASYNSHVPVVLQMLEEANSRAEQGIYDFMLGILWDRSLPLNESTKSYFSINPTFRFHEKILNDYRNYWTPI